MTTADHSSSPTAPESQRSSNQPEIVLIRGPFRVLAGVLAMMLALAVAVFVHDGKMEWFSALIAGWGIFVIAMLAITGKPWPDWTAMQTPKIQH